MVVLWLVAQAPHDSELILNGDRAHGVCEIWGFTICQTITGDAGVS